MGQIFEAEQLAAISEFIDDMIESFGKPCKLFYQPIFEQASNPLLLSDNTFFQNAGLHGGPIQGQTHNEGASGAVASQETETIYLVIDWTIKDNKRDLSVTKLPYGVIKTHGHLSDFPKIQKCIEMQANLPASPITIGRYKLLGDGGDIFSIVSGKYFVCYWERIS